MKLVLSGLAALFLLSGCVVLNRDFVRGSGRVTSEDRLVSDFQEVQISGSGEAVFVQGEEEGITIEMEDNLLPFMKTEVVGGKLIIGFERETSYMPTRPIKFEIRVKDLTQVDLSGAVNVKMESLSTTDLCLNMSGAGEIIIDQLTADNLDGKMSGATKMSLAGKVAEQKLDMSGSSTYDAEGLESNLAVLTASGSSKVKVWVHDDLTLKLSGSSDVTYYGTPKVSQETSGATDINAMGEK